MAHATVTPIMQALTPASGSGGVPTMELYAADGSIAAGDVLIFASGKVDEAAGTGNGPAADSIVGIAQNASAAASDPIITALALPGVRFAANTIGATADQTGVYAEDIGVACTLIINTAGAGWCLNVETTTAGYICAMGLRYIRQKGTSTDPTQKSNPLTAGVGVLNPRVEFIFVNSTFHRQTTQS